VGTQRAPLVLGGAAPDADIPPHRERAVKARDTHRAARAHLFGPLYLDQRGRVGPGWKEEPRIGVPARRVGTPVRSHRHGAALGRNVENSHASPVHCLSCHPATHDPASTSRIRVVPSRYHSCSMLSAQVGSPGTARPRAAMPGPDPPGLFLFIPNGRWRLPDRRDLPRRPVGGADHRTRPTRRDRSGRAPRVR
jgi:hypothetical protein